MDITNSNDKRAIVLGAGGHAKVVIAALRELGYTVEAVFDDNHENLDITVLGAPIRGDLTASLVPGRIPAVIAIGDNEKRRMIAHLLDREWMTVVHPGSCVDVTAQLGRGTVVMAGAVVEACAVIGKHVIINTNASVNHDCRVEDFVHVAPGACLGGNVVVGPGAFLGLGSVILEGRKIGAGCVIGAGAVVTRDIPPRALAVGVPAKPIRDVR